MNDPETKQSDIINVKESDARNNFGVGGHTESYVLIGTNLLDTDCTLATVGTYGKRQLKDLRWIYGA